MFTEDKNIKYNQQYIEKQNNLLDGIFNDFQVPSSDLMYFKPYQNIMIHPYTNGNWLLVDKGSNYELTLNATWSGDGYNSGRITTFKKDVCKLYHNKNGLLIMRFRSLGDFHCVQLIILNHNEGLTDKDHIVKNKKHKVISFKE